MHRRQRPSRIVAALATAAALGAPLVVFGIDPAAGGVCVTPTAPAADGRVRALNSPWTGRNEYGLNPLHQLAVDDQLPGTTVVFLAKYKNVSDHTRGITIQLRGAMQGDVSDFRLKVFVNGANVSEQFFAGELKLTGIPPGSATPVVELRLKMKSSAAFNDSILIPIRGAYGNSGLCGDVVGAAGGGET